MQAQDDPVRPNVLFIAIDDMRNFAGHLGDAFMHTPNIDRLAARGRSFANHYTQVPTCGASRASMLRGRYPEIPAHLGNGAVANTHQDWAANSLPGWFKRHDYRTLALGKITHHPGGRTGRLWSEGPEELPGVWDRSWIPDTPWGEAENIMHGFANGQPRRRGESPPTEAFDGPDTAYPDAWVAAEAVRTLDELASHGSPWFFAVGFFKPHLPFAAPKRHHERYGSANIPVATHPGKPEGVSSWHGSGEFRGNYGHQNRDPEVDIEYAEELRRSYAAAITYMDAQLGRLLDALDENNLWDNTVVVLWSDHGFLLGEHAVWGKHCLYEHALRSPLIICHPGMDRPGKVSNAIVESVDLFPTLTELCSLPQPPDLDGGSLVAQLSNPDAATGRPALGFWNRGQRTVRTDEWRLIVHEEPDGALKGAELFRFGSGKHGEDDVADQHPETVEALRQLLKNAPVPAFRNSNL